MLFGLGYFMIFIVVSFIVLFVIAFVKDKSELIGIGFVAILLSAIPMSFISSAGNDIVKDTKYYKNDIYLGDAQYYVSFNEYERYGECVIIKALIMDT